MMICTLRAVELGITADYDHVTGANQMGSCSVDADDSRVGSTFNGVRRQAIAVGDVINLDLLVLNDVGQFHQLDVDRHASLVMQLGLSDGGSMDLRFQENSVHALGFNNNLAAGSSVRSLRTSISTDSIITAAPLLGNHGTG